jgi:hypothetical protein
MLVGFSEATSDSVSTAMISGRDTDNVGEWSDRLIEQLRFTNCADTGGSHGDGS